MTPTMEIVDPIVTAVEGQFAWYDRKANEAQRRYRRIKVLELVIATSVPPMAGLRASPVLVSITGSAVVLLEGLLHLFQFQANWTTYRSTCEALRQELFLFRAAAGPYAKATNPKALLAERAQVITNQERAKWMAAQEQSGIDTTTRPA